MTPSRISAEAAGGGAVGSAGRRESDTRLPRVFTSLLRFVRSGWYDGGNHPSMKQPPISDHPLDEDCEEEWITQLNRFDAHIWPLFKDRGYTKGEAAILFRLVGLQFAIQDVNEAVREDRC